MSKIKAARVAPLALGLIVAGAVTASAQCGRASWYSMGTRTANGEAMRPLDLTAAHRSLPFGAKLRVTNMRNGKSVVVRVNDRGPFAKGRVLDVSKGAAIEIGMVVAGQVNVCMEKV